MPSKMSELLNMYINIRPLCEDGYIFAVRGKIVSQDCLGHRFRNAIVKLGIYDKSKVLTPHSLRFTYNTYTVNSNLLPGDVLRKMIGHKSQAMTDYYTRSDPETELKGLQPYQKDIDEIWNNVE